MYAWVDFGGGLMIATDRAGSLAGPQEQAEKHAPAVDSKRNVSLDVYRGFVMLLMMAEVLQLARVAEAYPSSIIWRFLAFNQTHVEWFGCSSHDTIQPGFSFLV